MNFFIKKASNKSFISSLTSGEGFVYVMEGPGKIFIQSRDIGAFGRWVAGTHSHGSSRH
ncbi:MAG: AIM24 family protein [Candidatus Caenarcaniphilales bacterium]|nr:AIM24 family protein [Candidatus Caenarcaniphilales bacterium]